MTDGVNGSHDESISKYGNYSDLFERLMDSGFLIDPESYAVLDTNSAAERVTALAREQILGTVFTNWVLEEQREVMEQALRIARRKYYPREVKTWMSFGGERRVLMDVVLCSLMLSTGRQVIQIITKDITREFEAEQRAAQYLQDLHAANQKLEELSITDEMTKLYNFRHFKKSLEAEHARASRYSSRYSVVFCDMDNFKHYNDRNGHPAGDDLLRSFAKVLKSSVRSVDLVARYGGEEFVVLCPETDQEGARELAERIRETVATTVFPFGEFQPLGKISISMGVASFPEDGALSQDVLEAADQGVYYSKKNGRNQVTSTTSLKKLGVFGKLETDKKKKAA